MVLAECGMNCKGRVTNWCTMYTQNFSKTFTKKMCASTRKKNKCDNSISKNKFHKVSIYRTRHV